MLGDEARVVGALLLARRGDVDHLPVGVDRLDLLLDLLGLLLLRLTVEVGDDLARGVLVDHAEVDRLRLVRGARGQLALEVGVARRQRVEPEADQQRELRVDERRDRQPESDPPGMTPADGRVRARLT